MTSANELLLSYSIEHSVHLAQYSNYVVARILKTLNKSDQNLFAALVEALDRMDSDSFTVERLESLLGSVRAINAMAYAQLGAELTQELRDFVEYEAAFQRQVMLSVLPVQVNVAAVSVEQVYSAAMSRPFQGRLLRGWLDDLPKDRAAKIRQTVAQGFVESRTTAQIVRELRGTRAKGYADGLLNRSRRDVETVVRTAVGHFAGTVQDRHMAENADIIKSVQWRSTIDLRTSPICRVRDGLQYSADDRHKPIGHSLPWLGGPGRAHFSCRSTQTPVLKSLRELGIDIDGTLDASSTRASLDGQIPAETTYAQWLEKQSYSRQVEVLGETRAKLLRDGNLSLQDMYSTKGVYLDLSALKARNAEAFRSAGL